jgi:ribonuclease G
VTKPVVPVTPGSPEEHAMMQREYARRMLDVEEEVEPTGQPQGEAENNVASVTAEEQSVDETQELQPPAEGEAQVPGGEPAEAQLSPSAIAAGVDPRQAELSENQPEARAPQPEAPDAEEELDEYEAQDEDEEPAGGLVYRPEPLIDAEAWADEVARASRSAEEAPAEAAASAEAVEAPVESSTAAAAEQPAGPVTTEPLPAEQIGEAAAVAQPVARLPLVTPLATPIPVTPRERDDEGEEDEDEDSMPRRRRRREHVNIADIVKEGQEILVQVAKDPIGTKGARLTCHVSLPGRYLVFMPTVDHIGVSRRIESEGERRRLKETMGKIRPSRTGVIVRTASGKQQDKNLKADLDYLVSTWNDIQKKFKKQRSPTLVYQDLTIVLRAIRDMFTDEVDKVVVDSKREHRGIMRFVSRFIPSVKSKVEL